MKVGAASKPHKRGRRNVRALFIVCAERVDSSLKTKLKAGRISLTPFESEATPRYFDRNQRSESVARILRRQKHYGGQERTTEDRGCLRPAFAGGYGAVNLARALQMKSCLVQKQCA